MGSSTLQTTKHNIKLKSKPQNVIEGKFTQLSPSQKIVSLGITPLLGGIYCPQSSSKPRLFQLNFWS
jgi:hypothetical protein